MRAEPLVSVIIPAYREAARVGTTVRAVTARLTSSALAHEVVVVDDGSGDGTAEAAEAAGARVIRLDANGGKGAAVATGVAATTGDVLLLLDADLGDSAAGCGVLLGPLLAGSADLVLAAFPVTGGRSGFGLVQGLARWGVRRAGGPALRWPLSGQRAVRREHWSLLTPPDPGFGLEMGMNLDACRAGLRIAEVPTEFHHRKTGRNLSGFLHRGRQFLGVWRAIGRRRLLREQTSDRLRGRSLK